jgi:carbonic anhydrase
VDDIAQLFSNNRAWANRVTENDPDFFRRLSRQQAPSYLWIGCSDSRVPANQIVDLLPGEMFVHRNVANVVGHADLNCLSTIQFAVDILHVRHIIVCGHYGCGGVLASLRDETLGLVDIWLRQVREVRLKHGAQIDALPGESARHDRLCELNVIEQVLNVGRTTIVRQAWSANLPLTVHGWIYDIRDGLLRSLDVRVASEADVESCFAASGAR